MSQNELAQTMMQQGQSYASANGNPALDPGGVTPRQALPPPAPATPDPGFRMVGEDIAPLFGALAMAQGEFLPIKRNRKNTYFDSSYADLEAVIAATSPALSKHGLAYAEFVTGPVNNRVLRSILAHKSGCYIETRVIMAPEKTGVQALGSELTYWRRYQRSAILSVFPEGEDDDGEAAEGRPQSPAQQRSQQSTQRTPPTTQQRPAPRQEAKPAPKPAEKVAQPAPKAAQPKEAPKSVDLSAEAGKARLEQLEAALKEARLEQFAAALKEAPSVPHDPETGEVRDDATRARNIVVHRDPSTGEVTEVTEDMIEGDSAEANGRIERIVELTPEESMAKCKAGVMQAGQLMQRLGIRQQAAGKAKLYEITGKSDQSTLTLDDIDYLVSKLSAEVAEKGL